MKFLGRFFGAKKDSQEPKPDLSVHSYSPEKTRQRMVDKLVTELISIGRGAGYKSTARPGPGGAFDEHGNNVRAAQIGRMLNKLGGIHLVDEALSRVSGELGYRQATDLESIWRPPPVASAPSKPAVKEEPARPKVGGTPAPSPFDIDKLKAGQDIDGLIELLHGHKDPSIRKQAAEALGEIGDRRAVPELVKLLEKRESQLGASLVMGFDFISREPPEDSTVERERILAPVRSMYVAIIEALGRIGDPRAQEVLNDVFHDEDADFRKAAAEALANLRGAQAQPGPAGGTSRASEELVQGLLSEDKATRQASLSRALQTADQVALDSVEEAIYRLAGRRDITFYQPGGLAMFSPQEAVDKVLALARDGRLLANPAETGSYIAKVAWLSNSLMDELDRLDPKALQIYQLLGVQMQLRLQLG